MLSSLNLPLQSAILQVVFCLAAISPAIAAAAAIGAVAAAAAEAAIELTESAAAGG